MKWAFWEVERYRASFTALALRIIGEGLVLILIPPDRAHYFNFISLYARHLDCAMLSPSGRMMGSMRTGPANADTLH